LFNSKAQKSTALTVLFFGTLHFFGTLVTGPFDNENCCCIINNMLEGKSILVSPNIVDLLLTPSTTLTALGYTEGKPV